MKEYFNVLRISRDDLLNVANGKDKKLIKKISDLPDNEMKQIAERIEEAIYDGDMWDNACREINDELV